VQPLLFGYNQSGPSVHGSADVRAGVPEATLAVW